MIDSDLKPCPFCGSENIYATYSQEYALGTKNPEIFCNSCKAIFSIEDDSPYMNCEEDYAYRRVKTAEAWNRRRLPSAQPERKKGRWIKAVGTSGIRRSRCSECGKYYPHDPEFPFNVPSGYNYCPNCGADMRGEQE